MDISNRLLQQGRKNGVLRLQETADRPIGGEDNARKISFAVDFLHRLRGKAYRSQAIADHQNQDQNGEAFGLDNNSPPEK
jgi:hypothetical protein